MYSIATLENTAALFAVILAAGFVVGKAKLLTKDSKSGMTNLVLYVTLPCTIVNSFRVDYDPSLLRGLVMTLVVAGISQALGQAASVAFFRRLPFERRSVFRYGMIVCNSAFFGLSVISALFGSVALPFAAIYLIPQRFAMWLLGVPVFSKSAQNRGKMVFQAIVHPSMIAVYIGMFIMVTRSGLPAAIISPISAIGACTMPIAMLLVGSILAEITPAMLIDRQIYFYCFLRLVLIPGIIFLVCLLLGLDVGIIRICVLMAGMPAATTASLLALRYGADERLGSTIITISTILFFAMLPAWMALFSLVA